MDNPPMHPPLNLYNTLTRSVEPFEPAAPPAVSMYVCGPTVYDAAHLGHARCYITWDVLYRLLLALGYEVSYARNLTDVDDKILAKAAQLGVSPAQVAQANTVAFHADMMSLNVLSPTHEPKATEHIPQMLAMVETLIAKGFAYRVKDGSVYYRASVKADYGKLSRKPLDDQKAGARVEVDPDKEHPADFALWKAIAPDDSHGWKSPWPEEINGKSSQNNGWGRPGWHIECSAMSTTLFGAEIDLHAGGADLMFPHHENEIAQSEACTGHTPFARHWCHNGFVNVSGEKMSKSLGNFSTVAGLLQAYDCNVLRYFLLTHHYRMPVDFTEEALQGAQNRLLKLAKQIGQAVASLPQPELMGYGPLEKPRVEHWQWLQTQAPAFCTALCNDMNTPVALAELNGALKILSGLEEAEAIAQQLHTISAMLLLLGFDWPTLLETWQESQQTEDSESLLTGLEPQLAELLNQLGLDKTGGLEALLNARAEAKAAKNWAVADAIRNGLSRLGLKLIDHKDGTVTLEKMG